MTKEEFDRMLQEFQENGERTNKLREFILNKDLFEQLDNLNRDLLISQLKAMETYISILSVRIGLNSQFAQDQPNLPESEENEQ